MPVRKLRCRFFLTEQDVDSDTPFYEINNPLAPRINEALQEVYYGRHSPFFTHIRIEPGGECGFIAICSDVLDEKTLRGVFDGWQQAGCPDEVYLSDEVYLF